jgi:hypothetical protein
MKPIIPVTPSLRAKPLHDAIATRAHQLWQGYGCPEGRDVAIWLEAEAQLLGTDSEVVQTDQGAVSGSALSEAQSGGKKLPGTHPKLTTNTSR